MSFKDLKKWIRTKRNAGYVFSCQEQRLVTLIETVSDLKTRVEKLESASFQLD